MENTTPARVYDPVKGLWYQDIPGKGRVYDSPAAYGQAPPEGGGGAFHKNTTWDQNSGSWDQGLDWGKIYAWAIAAGLGVNAASAIADAAAAGMAAGGGAGAAGAGAGVGIGETAGGFGVGGLSASSLGLPATVGLGTAGGAIPATAAAVGSGVAPAVGTAADTTGMTTGPVAPGAAASSWGPAGAAASSALTSADTLKKLAAGVGGLFGGKALGNYLNPNGGIPPELTQLLQLSLDRAKSQQPLFNQVNSGVSQMLPNFASTQGLSKLLGGG